MAVARQKVHETHICVRSRAAAPAVRPPACYVPPRRAAGKVGKRAESEVCLSSPSACAATGVRRARPTAVNHNQRKKENESPSRAQRAHGTESCRVTLLRHGLSRFSVPPACFSPCRAGSSSAQCHESARRIEEAGSFKAAQKKCHACECHDDLPAPVPPFSAPARFCRWRGKWRHVKQRRSGRRG